MGDGSTKLVEAPPATSLDLQGSTARTNADGANHRHPPQGSRHTHDTHNDDDAPVALHMDRRATAGDDVNAEGDQDAGET